MPISPELKPNSPIMIVGEAPGKSEELMGKPFVGASGQELDSMLSSAGIKRQDCSCTNVFLSRPPNNDLSKWWVGKKEGTGTPISKGKYFRAEHYAERARLYSEIEQVQPNIVIALGNTACWALLDKTGISALRGVVYQSHHITPKVIPTAHPAAVLRQYALRPVVITDFIKAERESHFRGITRPSLQAIINPDFIDVLEGAKLLATAKLISYDIETAIGQITCIGFAMQGYAICIPFVSYQQPDFSYWTPEDETLIWKVVKQVLENDVEKVTQNGLYDIQYLLRYGIRPRNSIYDTMLLHHSMQPELPKSLAFLGSVYTNYPSWKDMRPKGIETNKKEE